VIANFAQVSVAQRTTFCVR